MGSIRNKHRKGGNRRLSIAITTAGFDRFSACYRMYKYACDVRDGILEDEQFLPVIFEADEDDDIEATLKLGQKLILA